MFSLAALLITCCVVAARHRPVIAQGSDQSNISALYDWNKSKPGDADALRKWLSDNERLLDSGDGCSLSVSWADEQRTAYGSVHNIADFVVAPDEEGLTEVTRLIHDSTSGSGLDVRIGVQYFRQHAPRKQSLWEMRIALALQGARDDVFDEISRSEARTPRDKNWKTVGVVKETQVGSLRYRFTLACQNGKTYQTHFRPAAKRASAARSK